MFFCDIYDLSLVSSFIAFLPSLRVLKTSQYNDEKIKKNNVINEIRFVLIWEVNYWYYLRDYNLKFNIIQTLDLE